MKKRLSLIALVLIFALALCACSCKHKTWNDATCVNPKTCADCGETEGEALGHTWADATCEAPKTCTVCSETEGAPLGHTWAAATCETPKTCEVCAKTEGEALGHDWTDADCENPKTCARCQVTEGEALGHAWVDATTEAPKTCEACGLTEGEPISTDSRFTTAATADIQGKWGYVIQITGDQMGEPNFTGTLEYVLVMELNNDGTMAMYMELEDLTPLRDYLLETLYAEFAAQGIDKETADAAIKQNTGMTTEQYVDYALSMIDFEEILGSINFTGVYYVEGDLLYSGLTWDAEMSGDAFTLEGDTLTLMVDVAGEGTESTVFTRIVDEE